MWSLWGLGDKQVKLLEVCQPTLLHCSILGGKHVHPTTGRHMHALYVSDVGKVRPAVVGLRGDETDGSMKVEFDLAGPVHLNWPGILYLTDGDPSIEYSVSASVRRCPFTATWHPLAGRARAGVYHMPDHHSRIRTAGQAVTFESAGFTGTLDHVPIPVIGDNVLRLGIPDVTIITEWWG